MWNNRNHTTKDFTHVSSTDVHACSARITPQECSYKQKGTCMRGKYPEGKPRFPVPHPDGTLPLQRGVPWLWGGKGRASCYSGHASLLPALLEMSLGSYAKYMHRTLLLSADNLPCLRWKAGEGQSLSVPTQHRTMSPQSTRNHHAMLCSGLWQVPLFTIIKNNLPASADFSLGLQRPLLFEQRKSYLLMGCSWEWGKDGCFWERIKRLYQAYFFTQYFETNKQNPNPLPINSKTNPA